ncbi:MAG: tetratricopeptide repeat protein, partial [Crocinitomicaceae bacterium]
MFDDEEEDAFNDKNLNEELARFEAFEKGEPFGFLDSDRWEMLIDHFLMNGQYNNALLCAEEALTQFSYNNVFKLRLAQCYSAIGKLKESINLLTEIERLGVDSFELLLTKASVFSQLKDSKNGLKKLSVASIDLEISESDNRVKINSDD